MSDFLSNLVSRSADGVPPVLPRVPALFEPDPRDATPDRHEAAAALLVPARWSVPQTVAQPSAVAPPWLAISAAPAPPAAAAVAPAAPRVVSVSPEHRTSAPTAPRVVSVSPEHVVVVERRSPRLTATSLPQQSGAALAEPQQPASALPVEPLRERTVPTTAPLPSADPVAEARPVTPPLIAFVQPVDRQAAVQFIASQTAPQATSAPHAPQPIVHVSIGRVEVRAAPQAPARGAGDRTRPTVISLDEYLRSSEGRR